MSLERIEIKKRLQKIDRKLCVIFASRCSLRVLPFLVKSESKEAFGYWKQERRSKHLLSILTAQQAAAADYATGTVAYSSDAATSDSILFDTDVRSATDAATYSAYAAYATDAAYYTYHAASAADAAINTNIGIISEIEADLAKLESGLFTSKSWKLFLYSPLWDKEPPKVWSKIYKQFLSTLHDLNQGFDIWAKWYQDRVNGVPLDFELERAWLETPKEILAQGAKATNAYLATLTTSSTDVKNNLPLQQLNLVRAIFIGDGAVGKTSIIRKLKGEDVVEGKEEMTPGIEIREWQVPDSKITARFWDFGGQVMSHATHKFFLRERCLYVLLVDAGTEGEIREKQNSNDQAEYWLEHIKVFGNSAPVMLVGNKADKTSIHLNMNELVEKYPNVIGFYPVSCTSQQAEHNLQFQTFEATLATNLAKVGTAQVKFTANQFSVLEEIRRKSRKQAFLDHCTFDQLCKDYEIGKEGLDRKAYLGTLDALGEVIHFPDVDWQDAYVLNPRWLTYGVYTLLYSKEVEEQQGILSNNDVVKILQEKPVFDEQGNQLSYPTSKCAFIASAMSRFGLCYQLNNDNSYHVIPDKLPEDQPNLTDYFSRNQEDTVSFEYSFTGLLPRNIMPNLIVALHKDILRDKEGKQLVWQRGVVIQSNRYQAKARWQVDYQQRTINLWVQGTDARDYLVILREEIHKILDAIEGLSVDEYVLLPEFAIASENPILISNKKTEKATYKSLLEEAKLGRDIVISDAGIHYHLEKVLGFIMTKQQQKDAGVQINIEGSNIGAVGVGNKNKISGKVTTKLSYADKQEIAAFQQSLENLMSHIKDFDTDFEIKSQAYIELKEINQHLANLENSTPETKGKVRELLASVKDGTLGAIQLGKDIKEANEVTLWLMEKAAVVSAVLATIM